MDRIQNSGRIHVEWIDTAKVLTMMLVIIGHAHYYIIESAYGGISAIDNTMSPSLVKKIIDMLVGFIYYFHMPFFMCLSGMSLKLSIGNACDSGIFVRKRAKRLLYPFIFVTMFLSVPLKYWTGYYDNSSNVLSDIFFGQFLLLGNSHLWFVVSLFIISIVYYFLYKKQLDHGWLFWILVIAASASGFMFQTKQIEFLGVPEAMKNFLFFTLGFKSFEKADRISVRLWVIVFSWVLMFVSYFIFRGNFAFKMVLAIWGCINMIATSRIVVKAIAKYKWYSFMKKHSYSLYLYSDPFNYVIIALLVAFFGDMVVGDNIISAFAFLIRIIGSALMALVVIYILNHIISPLYKRRNTQEIYSSSTK